MTELNGASAVKFRVQLDFVERSGSIGYQKEEIVQCEDKNEAIVIAISRNFKEIYPLSGITVYECVFVA